MKKWKRTESYIKKKNMEEEKMSRSKAVKLMNDIENFLCDISHFSYSNDKDSGMTEKRLSAEFKDIDRKIERMVDFSIDTDDDKLARMIIKGMDIESIGRYCEKNEGVIYECLCTFEYYESLLSKWFSNGFY